MTGSHFAAVLLAGSLMVAVAQGGASAVAPRRADYRFDRKISRSVLERYLSRSISMEGLLNGRGDFEDNARMLKSTGAKFVGRALCLWGGEADLPRNLERACSLIPRLHAADPDMILQACVFEIVTRQVEQIPVPESAFQAFGMPAERRNFRYTDMIYTDAKRRDWGPDASVPDVSRTETKLWFYFLSRSFIDIGIEAIHYGQVELMGRNDPDRSHWSDLLSRVRAYAAAKARRHTLLCDGHVPSGGLVRDGRLLLDFHSFPLRIKEAPELAVGAVRTAGAGPSVPPSTGEPVIPAKRRGKTETTRQNGDPRLRSGPADALSMATQATAAPTDRIPAPPAGPQPAILQLGFSDGIYGKSKGGLTPSGWRCEHLPYLVEIDNWGASRQPGRAGAGGIWVWGYDEITWFAHQPNEYRAQWLRYAWDWVRRTDPSGTLEMPGSRTMRSPLDRKSWYYANDPGAAVPEGLGDEQAIKAIWQRT